MGIESYVANQLEQTKKYLKIYQDKQKKAAKRIWLFAIVALLVNVLCLFFIKFVSFENYSVSFFDLFDEWEKLDVGGVKFIYVLYWAVVVAGIAITALNYKNRSKEGAWIVPQLAVSGALTVISWVMMFVHMNAELEVTYSETMCFLVWFLPAIINVIYLLTPLMSFIYQKYIPIFENNIKTLESKE